MVTDVQLVQEYSEPIAGVIQYIRAHICEPLDREMLAEVAGFSVPHFHRIFRAEVGESAASYVRRLRMERRTETPHGRRGYHRDRSSSGI